MSTIGGLIGSAGGANCTGFAGPSSASIYNPVHPEQMDEAIKQSQAGLAQQQAFANATQPGGLQALQSQQSLLQQLGQQAQGEGPNPALAQLNQTTGQNVAQQNALMAGQRGSSANPALIARQAAQQGAATQQNAVGQAATMRAQQQLAAQQNLAAQQQAMVGQQSGATNAFSTAAQNQQNNLFNANAGVNNANVGMSSNINNNNAALAGIQMQGQQNLLGNVMKMGGSAVMKMGGSAMGMSGGGMVKGYDEGGEVKPNSGVEVSSPNIGSSSIPTIGNAFADSSGGGGGGGIMKMLPMLAMAAAGGGEVPQIAPMGSLQAPQGPQSFAGRYFSDTPQTNQVQVGALGDSSGAKIPGISGDPFKAVGDIKMKGDSSPTEQGSSVGSSRFASPDIAMAKGGKVPAMLSPGEKYLSPQAVSQVKQGADPMAVGKEVPGKPKVKGAKNDYANDTVPATLESGGIVLPRSVTQSKNPHWAAHKFVSALMAKNGKLK